MQRRGVTKSIILTVVLVLIAGAIGVFLINKSKPSAVNLDKAIVYKVFRGDFRSSIVESGDLESSSSIEIRCNVKAKGRGGTTILKLVPEGEMVEKDQFLAQLDDSVLRDELTQQQIMVATDEAAVIQAENDLATAEAILEEYKKGTYQNELAQNESEKALAEETMRRAIQYLEYSNRLSQKGYLTKTRLEADQFAVKKAEKDLNIASEKLKLFKEFTYERMVKELENEIKKQNANVKAARKRLDLSRLREAEFETQVAACKIIAPDKGMVVYANEVDRRGNATTIIEEGAILRDGQPIFRLPDPTKMQVLTTVNDSKINDVREGLPCVIRLDTDPDLKFRGRVSKVASFPLPRRWYQAPIEYEVWVEILEPTEQTRPGLRGKVEIVIEDSKDKIQAPVSSLVKDKDKYYVLVKKGNEIEARYVKIGSNNDQFIVIESGLEPGENVLIDPDKYLEMTDIEAASKP